MKFVSKRYARRFAMNAKPPEFQHALDRERFWALHVFDLLAKRCDEIIFDDPKDGLKSAKRLLDLARRVRDIDADRMALAYAILGSACRASSLYSESRQNYLIALEIAGTKAAIGAIEQRFAVLEWMEGNLAKAQARIEKAVSLLSGHDLGTALTIRGALAVEAQGAHQECVQDQSMALRFVDPNSLAYVCALRELASSLLHTHDLKVIEGALSLLEHARRVLGVGRSRRRTLTAFLDWAEGRILARLGSHRRAVVKLRKAQKRFMTIGRDSLRDVVIVSVDLALVFYNCGDFAAGWEELDTAIEIAECLELPELTLLRLCRESRDPGKLTAVQIQI